MNETFLAIREIYEKKSVSQRNLAKALDISVGKANKIVSELKKKKYIKDINNILTDKSIKLLQKNKVDTAVILASDKKIRDVNNEYKPIGLLSTDKDIILIERIISYLKERKIDDIYLVAHDMIERYEYLIDRYNIHFIYDEDDDRNNLSKILKVRDICEKYNTYIIDSDVYLNGNPFHEYEIETYVYGIYMEDLYTRYCMITNKNKEIISCEKGGENNFAYAHISYIDKNFSKILFSLFDKYNNISSAKDFIYIDVIIRNLDVLPPIYMYPLIIDKYKEINNIDDIKNIDDIDTDSAKFPFNKVEKAFDIKSSKITNIEKIVGRDKTFTFQIKDKKYEGKNYIIKKIDRNITDKSDNNKKLYEVLSTYPDFEKVIYEDKDKISIAEKYDDERMCDIYDDTDRKVILRTLKKIHNIKIDENTKEEIGYFNIDEVIDDIEKEVEDLRIENVYRDFYANIEKIKRIIFYMRGFKRSKCICKIDIDKDDFYYTNNGVKIKNIYNTSIADPLIDIASLGVLYNLDSENIYRLYEEYNKIIDIENIAMKNMQSKDASNIAVSFATIIYFIKAINILIKEYKYNIKTGDEGFKNYRMFKTCIKELENKKVI